MRFAYPNLPAEFEIPDDWWTEAGMTGFAPSARSYLSTDAMARAIPLRDIEPPFRFPAFFELAESGRSMNHPASKHVSDSRREPK